MTALGDAAIDYVARVHWPVFPLRGKVPAIAKADGGNGVLDATTDREVVARWWRRWPGANIGGRVPVGLVVVDIDPRHGGDLTWRLLEAQHGPVVTRSVITGRGDGGRHLYLRHPGGTIRAGIGAGIDVKTHAGYTLMPPSVHPDTGLPYCWVDPATPFAEPPPWLVNLLRLPPPSPPKPSTRTNGVNPATPGESPADWFTACHTWGDVLGPHGWHVVDGDGEHDGSSWRHPTATARWSATIRHGLLFIYTTSTLFEPTTPADPHGYTRFAAHAVLDHGGDQSAAARAVRAARTPTR